MVRARFKLAETHNLSSGGTRLVFRPEYDPTIEADRCFAKATPNGNFEMIVDNPAALAQFKLGEDYFVDFHACNACEAADAPKANKKGRKGGAAEKAAPPASNPDENQTGSDSTPV